MCSERRSGRKGKEGCGTGNGANVPGTIADVHYDFTQFGLDGTE